MIKRMQRKPYKGQHWYKCTQRPRPTEQDDLLPSILELFLSTRLPIPYSTLISALVKRGLLNYLRQSLNLKRNALT